MKRASWSFTIAATLSAAFASTAWADPGSSAAQQPEYQQEQPVYQQPIYTQPQPEHPIPRAGFIEAGGTWGFQLGPQPYVPDGTPGSSKHPLTNGFGFNGTLGIGIGHGLYIIGDYAWAHAKSRKGDIAGVVDRVQGKITYQTIDAGLRMTRDAGPGALYGELGLGVMVPFSTKLEIDYGPALAAAGLTGTGVMENDYNWGVGGHGEFGYQLNLGPSAYLATGLRLQTFESNNDGKQTELTNFTEDFADPTPVTATINHGTTSAATPTAYSVQDIRLHADLGVRF